MVTLPSLGTMITVVVGIVISVFTGYLSYKVQQSDKELREYRKMREMKEEKKELLTLGMARSMLLQNYDHAMAKGCYTVDERRIYHELYEAYKGSGGNGVVDELAEKIKLLPTDSPKKRKGGAYNNEAE